MSILLASYAGVAVGGVGVAGVGLSGWSIADFIQGIWKEKVGGLFDKDSLERQEGGRWHGNKMLNSKFVQFLFGSGSWMVV